MKRTNSGRSLLSSARWFEQENKTMTVYDAMREFRKIKDAIDILDQYSNGEMLNIAEQHVDEIRNMLKHYMDMIEKLKIVE